MTLNALGHLRVQRGRRGDQRHREARCHGQALREVRLACPRSAENQHEAHQKSMPRIALMPWSNACLPLRISVTVSAISISGEGASRPVAMTFTEGGRPAIAATTSAAAIQPQLIVYVISSCTTTPKPTDSTFSQAARQASRATASDSFMSCESHVNPSPSVHHSTPSRAAISRSPVFHLSDLMNCTTHTFQPRAKARSIVPNAAVDLPLPSPVLTMTID